MRKLLLLLLAIGAIVQTTKAQVSHKTINGIEYAILANGTASVSMCIDKNLSNVEIPDKVYGYVEDEWGDEVFYGYAPVVSLQPSAFSGCINLETIKLPETITDIYWSAFNGCTSLSSIKLPATLNRVC